VGLPLEVKRNRTILTINLNTPYAEFNPISEEDRLWLTRMTCRKYWALPFQQQELLTQALTHSSYANENPGTAPAPTNGWNFWGMQFWASL